MNIVFCVDRGVLPGLHVAAFSLLSNISPTVAETRFHVFSEELDESDIALLRQTLASLKKGFVLELRRVPAGLFAGFPSLNDSLAAYYRLVVPQILDVERYLYVDADTLCDLDVGVLDKIDFDKAAAALVPEAPLSGAVDRMVAEQLGKSSDEPYYNSGVILVNVPEWRRQKITERALEYIAKQHPIFHDQSALNVVLRGSAFTLDDRFNCITNMRKHWPVLRSVSNCTGCLIHFVDYPKPWSLFGEVVHPHYWRWRSILKRTMMKNFRSWHATPSRKSPNSRKAWCDYQKAFKDRLLFAGYSRGWLKNIKGVP